jgi:hypothetical protein
LNMSPSMTSSVFGSRHYKLPLDKNERNLKSD